LPPAIPYCVASRLSPVPLWSQRFPSNGKPPRDKSCLRRWATGALLTRWLWGLHVPRGGVAERDDGRRNTQGKVDHSTAECLMSLRGVRKPSSAKSNSRSRRVLICSALVCLPIPKAAPRSRNAGTTPFLSRSPSLFAHSPSAVALFTLRLRKCPPKGH
jgi:hypothetical protein